MRQKIKKFCGAKMWRAAALAICTAVLSLAAVAMSVTALAAGPGDFAHGGPGDTAPARNNAAIYDYPGFKGAGPGRTNMIISWDYGEWGPASSFYYDNGGGYVQGWRYSPDGWWYQYSDGSWPAGGWKCIDSRWYYFEETGHLKTGWLEKDGIRYYLNPVDDGSFGAMRTGWQVIDGKDYYFNMSSEGVYGALLANTITPDGYQVGSDGARIIQEQ